MTAFLDFYHLYFGKLNRCVFNVFLRERGCGSREGKAGMRSQGMSVGGAEMVRRCIRRYGLAIGLIFTTGRRNAREYKGILCRGSPVPLCKGEKSLVYYESRKRELKT